MRPPHSIHRTTGIILIAIEGIWRLPESRIFHQLCDQFVQRIDAFNSYRPTQQNPFLSEHIGKRNTWWASWNSPITWLCKNHLYSIALFLTNLSASAVLCLRKEDGVLKQQAEEWEGCWKWNTNSGEDFLKVSLFGLHALDSDFPQFLIFKS